MEKLARIGQIFYGVSIAAMGFQTIYFRDFPYMLIPPAHSWLNGKAGLVYASGALLILSGACIVFRIKPMLVSLLLGSSLLAIFCFYFIPYEFMVSPNYMHWYDWENAMKELALAGGAFVVAGCFSKEERLRSVGTILFSLTIISFGVSHLLYAKEAGDYIPSWVPGHLFWMYFTGLALVGSAVAIILKIQSSIAAALLGTMIFIWVLILHIPKAIASPIADSGGEVTSGFLALCYCGIAFAISTYSYEANTYKNPPPSF